MLALVALAADARAQDATGASRWFVDLAVGLAPSINGNVSSGAIGVLQGQAAAFLPQTYGDVYGTGIDWRVGGGYTLDEKSEVRAMFSWQSGDADLVRLGDIGPSSLYALYDDYKSFALDLGYRRYFQLSNRDIRLFGEGTMGVGIIDAIGVHFAAPQSNVVFPQTNYYDRTAAFTIGFNFGALFKFSDGAPFVGWPTPARLNLQTQSNSAAISIQGAVSARYRLEAATSLSSTNWTILTNLALPSSPYMFTDTTSSNVSTRFYRVVGVP